MDRAKSCCSRRRATARTKAIAEVRRALLNAGLRGKIFVGSYVPPDRSLAAPIRLSFVGLKALVTTPCGQWPDDLASGSSLEGWKNESYANFGCATQSMLAAQVADPRDFVTARALDPSDVAMRTRAIEAVRNGEDPGTQWKDTKLNPIGADLPSTGSQ
jgi:pilus assembly protein CpaD